MAPGRGRSARILPTPTFPNYLGEYTVKTDVESWAGYGQATWTPDVLEDKLDLTLGLRYTDDERDATRTNDGWAFNSFAPGATDSQMDRVDYTAIADYSWTDDVSTYAKVSTGFRSGGSSRNGLDFNQPFDKEDLISYELGWKSEMLDQRVRVNGATYFMQVNDIILDYLPDPVTDPAVRRILQLRRCGCLRSGDRCGCGDHRPVSRGLQFLLPELRVQ